MAILEIKPGTFQLPVPCYPAYSNKAKIIVGIRYLDLQTLQPCSIAVIYVRLPKPDTKGLQQQHQNFKSYNIANSIMLVMLQMHRATLDSTYICTEYMLVFLFE